ncbi:MAG: sigma-E factor negative regulatory protein [Gammaproteobacteria bacterium]|jgi:sigma-E factor negative regulatory protein RseA
MSNQFDEQFSALVDGEEVQSSDVLARIQQDDELRRRWQRYHMIRDALTGHIEGQNLPDISSQVSQALENEPTILAPKRKVPRLQTIYKQASGFAVAAAVATVAVITVQQTQVAQDSNIQTAAINNPVTNVQVTTVKHSDNSRLDSAVESKLSGYLVQHNEYSVAAKMQGALPYMRIVSVTPGKRIDAQAANEK